MAAPASKPDCAMYVESGSVLDCLHERIDELAQHHAGCGAIDCPDCQLFLCLVADAMRMWR